MGGIVRWSDLKKQIVTHLQTDATSYVTMLIDYYGLSKKHNFPSWDEAEIELDRNTRMDKLEQAMYESIDSTYRFRFIPYIQLHEFEGLLFNNIEVFEEWITPENLIGLDELKTIISEYDNPEMINNNKETSPSYRLDRIIKGYNKVLDGNILADAIGLERIREKSPRFAEWIGKLEKIKP